MSAGDWKSLYQAAVEGDLSVVRYHLAEGADPNHQHPEILRTPLVASVIEGHLAVADCLLAHGADPNLVSVMDSLSPLEAAIRHGHHALAQRLRQLGAREQAREPFWWRWLPV